VQQCGFANPIAAKNGEALTGLDGQIQAAHD